jgi:hypothetical protein
MKSHLTIMTLPNQINDETLDIQDYVNQDEYGGYKFVTWNEQQAKYADRFF